MSYSVCVRARLRARSYRAVRRNTGEVPIQGTSSLKVRTEVYEVTSQRGALVSG